MRYVDGGQAQSLVNYQVEDAKRQISARLQDGKTDFKSVSEAVYAEIDNPVFFSRSNSADTFINKAREFNPESVMTGDEAAYRRETAEKFAANLWKVKLRYEGVTMLYPLEDRTLNTFLIPSFNQAANLANSRFHRIMTSGTEAEKKNEISRRIEQIGNLDLNGLDFADDRHFAVNYEKYYNIYTASDTENILNLANKYNIDLTEPRFAKFCAKAEPLHSLHLLIGTKEKLIGNDMYSEIDLMKLSDMQALEFSGIAFNDKPFISATASRATMFGENASPAIKTMLDEKRPANERTADFISSLNEKSRLLAASKERAEREKQNYLSLSEQEKSEYGFYPSADYNNYFAKKINGCLSNLANNGYDSFREIGAEAMKTLITIVDMQREYTRLASEGKAPVGDDFYLRFGHGAVSTREKTLLINYPEINATCAAASQDEYEKIALGDFDAVVSFTGRLRADKAEHERAVEENPHDYFKAKILENINEIKKAIPDFSMTDEEIEEMITPEKIERHRIAQQTVKTEKQADAESRPALAVPFARVWVSLSRPGDTEENRAYNDELYRKLSENSAEGLAFRREKTEEVLNRIKEVNASKFSGKTEAEIFDYSNKNYKDCYLAFELSKFVSSLPDDNMRISDELNAEINDRKSVVQGLGGYSVALIRHYADENSFTFPTHKLTFDQLPGLFSNKCKFGNTLISQELNFKYNIKDFSANLKKPGLNSGISAESVSYIKPADEYCIESCAELREKLAGLGRELKSADHIWNFKNSPEYDALNKAFDNTVKLLSEIEAAPLSGNNKDRLYESLKRLNTARVDYRTTHPKNSDSIRSKRLDVTDRTGEIINSLISSGGKDKNAERTDNPEGRAALDCRFNMFAGCHNAVIDRKAEADARNYYQELKNRTPGERERIFNEGLAKTARLGELAATCAEGTAQRYALDGMVEARNELVNFIGRKEINADAARALMAKEIAFAACFSSRKLSPETPVANLDAIAQRVASDRNFINLTKKIDSDGINKFLGAGEDEKLLKSYKDVLAKTAQAGREQPDVFAL